jgi:hypothetical protein
MASPDTVREKLSGIYVAAEELPDIPGVPRQVYVARDDAAGTLAVVAGTLASVAVTAAAYCYGAGMVSNMSGSPADISRDRAPMRSGCRGVGSGGAVGGSGSPAVGDDKNQRFGVVRK